MHKPLIQTLVMVGVYCGTVVNGVEGVRETKCTEHDQRKLYSHCELDYAVLNLWCDQTNFTKVPAPQTVKSYAAPELARKLFMNDSCISVIRSGDLSLYTELETFDCSSNILTVLLEPLYDRPEPALRDINFQFNKIRLISSNAFSGLASVERLNLKHNRLKALEDDVFTDLTNLKTLHLDQNNLDHIRPEVFSRLFRLKTLTLQHNHLRSWIRPSGCLTKLKFLELDGNRMRKIVKHNLRGMRNLLKVSLSNNSIQFIAEGSFDSNHKLRYIDLSNNEIRHLPNNLFQQLCQLSVLYLGENQLVTPHPQWFATFFVNVKFLDHAPEIVVSGNRWSCDSNATDYWDVLVALANDNVYSSMVQLLDLKCSTPHEVKGYMLSNLTKQPVSSEEGLGSLVMSNMKANESGPIEVEHRNRTKNTTADFETLLSAIKKQCDKKELSRYKDMSRRLRQHPEISKHNDEEKSKEESQSGNLFLFVALLCVAALLIVLFPVALFVLYRMKHEKQSEQVLRN